MRTVLSCEISVGKTRLKLEELRLDDKLEVELTVLEELEILEKVLKTEPEKLVAEIANEPVELVFASSKPLGLGIAGGFGFVGFMSFWARVGRLENKKTTKSNISTCWQNFQKRKLKNKKLNFEIFWFAQSLDKFGKMSLEYIFIKLKN